MEAGKDIPGQEEVLLFGRTITVDYSRDAKLTPFAKATLTDRYLWEGENFQTMFARVAAVNSDNNAHAQRLYDYISNLWFMPATPVLSNSGSKMNYTISCFVQSIPDSLDGIEKGLSEAFWLGARGGGLGSYFGKLRTVGEKVSHKGETSGVIPFMHMLDSLTLGVSQGGTRRSSAAVYLDINNAEIEEFMNMRKPTGGDPHRKNLNLHHSVVIPDWFMEAVRDDGDCPLISPHNGSVKEVVKARKLWEKLLKTRIATGEPYLMFVDNANRQRPESYVKNNLMVETSQLCNEIFLHTGPDYVGKHRTAVCCLSSFNLDTWDEWNGNEQFVEDVFRFLDNTMTNFIKATHGVKGFEQARYSAQMERSVGAGVMGFHSFLQSKGIPFESVMAKVWNKKIHSWLHEVGLKVNDKLATERGPCPDAIRAGINKRFSHMFAIAPTASISIIAGEAAPGIEPYAANSYKQKTLSGSFNVRNRWLDKILRTHAKDEEELEEWWQGITGNGGSVQGLECLTDMEKMVFKTAFELDQRWVIEHAADRQPFICQGQSVNLFLPATVSPKVITKLHFDAWKKGLKGLYYQRSKSVNQVSNVAGELPEAQEKPQVEFSEKNPNDGEECLSCQ